MSTLSSVELGVLGPLQVRQFGLPVTIPGAKPRAVLAMLGLCGGAVVPGETLVELLWGTDPPRTAAKALQTHISALRRVLGDGFVLTQGTGWTLNTAEVDAVRYTTVAGLGREALAAGDASQAVAHFEEALRLWRGSPELPDSRRGSTERTRWVEGHAALVEDRADALLATGRAAELIGELEAAIADAPLRERRWGQLMLALYRTGRQGEALAAYQRVRGLLADELGVDPGPNLRRLESKIVVQDVSLELPASQHVSAVMRAVTFLLTDIEGSTAAWEADADAMGEALARHDEIVEQAVTFRGGRLIKTRGEGDATFSVFDRPSAAAEAAVELQRAIRGEPWSLATPLRIRVALHTGEVEFRDGDYFGRAVNRAARLRSLATGGQTLCSGATAELVIDSLADDVVLADLGMRQLKNLARPEHVFELRLERADDSRGAAADAPLDRPALPTVLTGPGPFVGRGSELDRLLVAWRAALASGTHAVLIAGEPGVGKTRLAGEWSRQAYGEGAVVVYGRCDEDLGAPYQPFAEALRTLAPCLGTNRLRGLRGVESLLSLVPALTDVLPDVTTAPRAAPDAERYALFDAVVAVLDVASAITPIVVVLDDLHWAAKPTLLLLRHLLRFGEHARVQIVGTYRSTDLDRAHPLAAMLADLHRDGSADRLALGGLDEDDVTAYVAEAGYADEELARALASVTGGNPFFLIEALRHVDESDGRWDPNSLPQGVREAVSRRLSRLPEETNKALAAAAVVGSRFAVDLVERVVARDLVDAFDEAGKAGIVIEEPGGRYRFNHALVRQSLLAELPSVRRMRLHQKIAVALESEPGDDDERLAEIAYHYFECAWAGNAGKAVEYCRRAADQAMTRLGYEGAADLYDKALHALEELDEELPDREDQQAELLVARCEALLAAGDVGSATGAVAQLRAAAGDSDRIAAWGTCFDGQLSMLTDPERLDEIESLLGAAAATLAGLQDAAGEAKAHTVRAGCLARLGRIADCEIALDQALTAARRAREHRRVNAVLAGAPLAALWGPNPVPRAGGRCLDVVRLLRITTGSPVVEATSTRCQAVLDALRGRASAGRQLIDSARRTLNELGMRHAVLEVEQFAGVVELIADDAAAAERYLRKAYDGFRRMRLDADTAETAALLARACLALGEDAEADELCTESERLAGHAFKAAIAWRSVRAQLSARGGDHDGARRIAEEAVAIAERTDALVDHGDACLALATVLAAADDAAGARAAAGQAVGLYELKGAAALADKARRILGTSVATAPGPSPGQAVDLDNACVRAVGRVDEAWRCERWRELESLLAPTVRVENRRKIVGFSRGELSSAEWVSQVAQYRDSGMVRYSRSAVTIRGERLALARLWVGTEDISVGAPQDEMLALYGIDQQGHLALQITFDIEDMESAIAELDAQHDQVRARQECPALQNAATRVVDRINVLLADRRWDEIEQCFAGQLRVDDRRRGILWDSDDRAAQLANLHVIADLGITRIDASPVALRGDRLCLARMTLQREDAGDASFGAQALVVTDVDADGLIVNLVSFDPNDFDAAVTELDARYLAGDAAEHADTWSVVMQAYAAVNAHESPGWAPDAVNVDRRRAAPFAPGELTAYLDAAWGQTPDVRVYVEAVHRLDSAGAVVTHVAKGTSPQGFEAEWRELTLSIVDGNLINRSEMFDETGLDDALARFDELSRPATWLENSASRTYERWLATYEARDWDAMTDVMTDGIVHHDRRRVANGGSQVGRDAVVANMHAIAEVGVGNMEFAVIATRGDRLVLGRQRVSGDKQADAFGIDVLIIAEVDADQRFSGGVAFDLDELDTALVELDARYLAGEASAHSDTWSVIVSTFAALNLREYPATTQDWINIDHRSPVNVPEGRLAESVDEKWSFTADVSLYVEVVHQLNHMGAVVTFAVSRSSQQGIAANWREVALSTVTGNRVNRCEIFNGDDLDSALARFDELNRPAMRLENTASEVTERVRAMFVARDWDGISASLAPNFTLDDRRRTVNGGISRGRDTVIRDMQLAVDVGFTNLTEDIVALRGARLVLTGARYSGSEAERDRFVAEVLHILEIDVDQRIIATIVFDADDADAAFTELESRYVAGEAAIHSHTWSLVASAYAATNRHETPTRATDVVDRRRLSVVEGGDLIGSLRAAWDLTPDGYVYIEAVHRLDRRGAVVTHVAHGTGQGGFDAGWRSVNVLTVGPEAVECCELFDETDLDTALARLDVADRRPVLENPATRTWTRLAAAFNRRDVDEMMSLTGPEGHLDDRRTGVRDLQHGSERLKIVQTLFEYPPSLRLAIEHIATRGSRLCLSRQIIRDTAEPGAPITFELLTVLEIDDDGRAYDFVNFDADDLQSASTELEARFLAGEAAPYADTWKVLVQNLRLINRRELPAWTPNVVSVDHRSVTPVAPGDMPEFLRATWDETPDVLISVEAVHRLNDHGAAFTHVAVGSSPQGFEAEWRGITVSMLDGDRVNHSEHFDESDLEAAIARFDELSRAAAPLQNTATRAYERFCARFTDCDWAAIADLLAADHLSDDRRSVVGAGIRYGRDAELEDLRGVAAQFEDIATTAVTIATRGDRLMLCRGQFTGHAGNAKALHWELLGIVETGADESITAFVVFDLEDIEAAIAELDARYAAGEAAPYARTWSVIVNGAAAFHRHEIPPATADSVSVDHRHAAAFAPGDFLAFVRSTSDVVSDMTRSIEAVHRLSDVGAVVTGAGSGTSHAGFAAEWRVVVVVTIDGDLVSRYELFDEADLEAALARFDELDCSTTRLQNAASRVGERLRAAFAGRDWSAMAELIADDLYNEDRRRVVNAGVRRGRDSMLADMRAGADVGIPYFASVDIATRGERLVLVRAESPYDDRPGAFRVDNLAIAEIDAENRIVSQVMFDPDDLDDAFAELDARYLAGEAAVHSQTWSAIVNANAAFNRREMPATTPDWVNVDNRRGGMAFAPGDQTAYMHATWDVAPQVSNRIVTVHRLDDRGVVFTQFVQATSRDDFNAEWRDVVVMTFDGALINRCEVYDEDDLETALARFDELDAG